MQLFFYISLIIAFFDFLFKCYGIIWDIGRQKNDGSSTSFKGDGLVNLFLFTWNAFLHGRKVKILNDIEFNINTVSDPSSIFDDDVLAIVKNMENEIEEHKKITK